MLARCACMCEHRPHAARGPAADLRLLSPHPRQIQSVQLRKRAHGEERGAVSAMPHRRVGSGHVFGLLQRSSSARWRLAIASGLC